MPCVIFSEKRGDYARRMLPLGQNFPDALPQRRELDLIGTFGGLEQQPIHRRRHLAPDSRMPQLLASLLAYGPVDVLNVLIVASLDDSFHVATLTFVLLDYSEDVVQLATAHSIEGEVD